MEYLDFSSVITTIHKHISDAHNMNQLDLMYDLFVSFLNDENSLDFTFDNGLVCRWFNGQAKSVLVSLVIIWIAIIETVSLPICTETYSQQCMTVLWRCKKSIIF